MIQFTSIQLKDFAVYKSCSFNFSVDPEKPLTLIRGENQSGKTTLMRAFKFVLFGPKGIGSTETLNATRPPWAIGESVASVILKFNLFRPDNRVDKYQISRQLKTNKSNGKVVEAFDQVSLSGFQPATNEWVPIPLGPERLNIIIKPSMRDFYFLDADQATEYTGGQDANRLAMREAVSSATRALLGLDELQQSCKRIKNLQNDLIEKIGAAPGGNNDFLIESNRVAAALKQAEIDLNDLEKQCQSAEDEASRANKSLNEYVGGTAQGFKTLEVIKENTQLITNLSSDLDTNTNELTAYLVSSGFTQCALIWLFKDIVDTYDPMKQQGFIPMTELAIVDRLLRNGECLCGCDLNTNSTAVDKLKRLRDTEATNEEGSKFLDQLLEGARSLLFSAKQEINTYGPLKINKLLQDMNEISSKIGVIRGEVERLNEESDYISTSQSDGLELKAHYDACISNRDRLRLKCQQMIEFKEKLQIDSNSIGERIRIAAARTVENARLESNHKDSSDLYRLLESTYISLNKNQIDEIGISMSRIYRDIVSGAATGDQYESKVGVRTIQINNKYNQELYAESSEGVDKPIAMLNGASRRALAIAFSLSLAECSSSKNPLVADSLLNVLAGSVLYKMLNYLVSGEYVAQPIIFGTGQDFLQEDIRHLILSRAGKSYTLTSQAAAGGDVLIRTPNTEQLEVIQCECDLAHYCDACQRKNSISNGLTKR